MTIRKTKIICTIGPSSEDLNSLKLLIQNGMDVARLNFSHGSAEEHIKKIKNIKEARALLNKPVAILVDTKGPEIRTGILKDGFADLKEGSKFTLTTDDIIGNFEKVTISYKELYKDVIKGSKILIDDGLIELRVEHIDGTDIVCQISNGNVLSNNKSITVPGLMTNLPGITEKDINDIMLGIEYDVDFVAPSFVTNAKDILTIRELLNAHNSQIKIISKIENREGLNNLQEIIRASDGIMIARGDLGVEIPVEELPLIQKQMIKDCNRLGKIVVTATQMLDSMQRNPRPTRAEASDIANAIFDGTGAIMLSGETASGKYPLESVKTMAKIANQADNFLPVAKFEEFSGNITECISQSVVQTANILNCKAILTATESGFTARMISKFRPSVPIIAITPHWHVARNCNLLWGVYPLVSDERSRNTDHMFEIAVSHALKNGFVREGELVVITAGVPVGKSGTTNLIKVHKIGESLTQSI